jgi:hypothetical protein
MGQSKTKCLQTQTESVQEAAVEASDILEVSLVVLVSLFSYRRFSQTVGEVMSLSSIDPSIAQIQISHC